MKKGIGQFFEIERKPRRGLIAMEWAVIAYLLFTLLVMMVVYTKLVNPAEMLWGRARVVFVMAALWAVYRLVPCRAAMFLRVAGQLAMLAWWYPDTYELNRVFPNLDHLFIAAEQSLFGFQPALVFADNCAWPVVSEMMSFGYTAFYPMIAVVALFYFLRRYDEFQRCAFIIMASFCLYYVLFVLVPVAGPTFYYRAVGLDNIAHGVFPALGDYFNTHHDCLVTPGYSDGFFYGLVEDAKSVGERPTAAFPSSHVGISTVLMLLILHTRNRTLTLIFLSVYVLLCLSTVYIQAHYAIDSITGFVTGLAFYAVLFAATKKRMGR